MAHSLALSHQNTPWDQALCPFVQATVCLNPTTANQRTTFLHTYMDTHALTTQYFLMTSGSNVGVATGIFPCPHLLSPGVSAYLIWNDHTCNATGQMVYPNVMQAHGNLDLQADSFVQAELPVMEFHNIMAAFDGQADLPLVPRLQPTMAALAVDPGTVAPTIPIWAALLIHPKLACLFMGGMPVHNAAILV